MPDDDLQITTARFSSLQSRRDHDVCGKGGDGIELSSACFEREQRTLQPRSCRNDWNWSKIASLGVIELRDLVTVHPVNHVCSPVNGNLGETDRASRRRIAPNYRRQLGTQLGEEKSSRRTER